MTNLNTFGWYMRHQNKLFWTIFILLGIFIIMGILGSIFFLDVIFGFIIIIIGIEKLREEIQNEMQRKDKSRVCSKLDSINRWIDSSTGLVSAMNDRYNNRFFYMGNRHDVLETELENKYRELVRKILEIENKMKDTRKALSILASAHTRAQRGKKK